MRSVKRRTGQLLALAALVETGFSAVWLTADGGVLPTHLSKTRELRGDALLQQSLVVRGTGPFIKCRELAHLIDCSLLQPESLGAGSYGEAWLVKISATSELKGQGGKKAVLKLLHHPGKAAQLLYPKDLKRSYTSEVLDEAIKACAVAQALTEGSSDRKHERSRQRILHCFLNNFDTKTRNEPLALLLEFGGRTTLLKFQEERMHAGQWSLATVRQLIKQLLEGVAYLQSFPEPWIHHDLKPENVVVKLVPGRTRASPGEPVLKLIDFDGTVQHNPEEKSWCFWKAATGSHAPPEWKYEREDPDCASLAYAPDHPKAFDMWSLGAMVVKMLTDVGPAEVAALMRKKHMNNNEGLMSLPPTGFDFPWTHQHSEIRGAFERKEAAKVILTLYADTTKKAAVEEVCRAVLADPEALSFFELAFQTLRGAPGERPLAEQLLQDPWMKGFASNDDPDIKEAEEIVQAAKHAAAEKRVREASGEDAQNAAVEPRRTRRAARIKSMAFE